MSDYSLSSNKEKAWVEFMETPLAELETYGMVPKYITQVEEKFGLYVRDVVNLGKFDLDNLPNFGKATRRKFIDCLIQMRLEIYTSHGVSIHE